MSNEEIIEVNNWRIDHTPNHTYPRLQGRTVGKLGLLTTTPIVRIEDENVVVTRSGTHYQLCAHGVSPEQALIDYARLVDDLANGLIAPPLGCE